MAKKSKSINKSRRNRLKGGETYSNPNNNTYTNPNPNPSLNSYSDGIFRFF